MNERESAYKHFMQEEMRIGKSYQDVFNAGFDAALASQAQQPSIEDVQSLVYSSKIMLKWCVKNVQQWNFSEYDWLHRATEKVKASLPPAPEGEKP